MDERWSNFIHDAIDGDLAEGRATRVQTRFPPEPNGYLHIGHVKAICIDFGTAAKYGGTCCLRFDDTNPEKEDTEYVDAIKEDIRWLGFTWDRECYASDYFDFIYECAWRLIDRGLAYVDELSPEEIREYRGTLTESGRDSPYRDRPVEETRELFRRMAAGEIPTGSMVLRAKIDMSSPNLNMRDPVIYRVLNATHHRTGDRWHVYPMYDFAHPLSDAAEGVTYSLCSLEFENHRPLYNWVLWAAGITEEPPRQIEFARLNLNYCLTSKRKCLELISRGAVSGWDDPRMATVCGMRRRGYPAAAVREFIEKVGVSKAYSIVDYALLESCVRDNLNTYAERAMAVLRPLKVVVDNYPEGGEEPVEVARNPSDPAAGRKSLPFTRELYIERDDFSADPPPKYYRLVPGGEVRLKGAYIVKYAYHETDERGDVTAVHVTYDPESEGGEAPDGRRVKGTIHWVSAVHAVDATVRLYDRLFRDPDPGSAEDLLSSLNPGSVEVLEGVKCEPSLADAKPGVAYQFMRQGYFTADKDSSPGKLVFNRTVSLKDSFPG